MLIILLGHTCSGTSYLLKEIELDKKIEILLESTDRPKRFDLEEGYVFLSQEEFKKKDFLCKVEFETKDEKQKIYKYAISNEILNKNFKKNNYIIRTNLELTKEILKKIDLKNILIINLYVSDEEELKKRFSTRKNLLETERRYLSDLKKLNQFKKENENEKFFFNLESNNKTIKKLYERIKNV